MMSKNSILIKESTIGHFNLPFYKSKKILWIGVVSLLTVPSMSSSVGAQELAERSGLEEIVVTAQNRQQDAQSVAISLSAFDGRMLAASKISDSRDIAKITPGLSGSSQTSFLDTFSMRGISTTDLGFGGDPSIAIYQDNVYQGRTGSSLGQLYDIERVEVLNGPQGLLFGRNAAAGVIHSITAKPQTDAFGGYVQAGAGSRKSNQIEGAVNVPISDKLAARFAGYHNEEDGWVKNLQGGGDRGGYNREGLRTSIRYEGDQIAATLTGEYEDRESSGTLYSALDTSGKRPLTGDEWVIDSDLTDGDFDRSEVKSLTLNVEWDVDFATITSITGFKGHSYEYTEDSDGTSDRINDYFQEQEGDYYSQEFRLVSNDSGNMSWFLGASAYWEDLEVSYAGSADEETICDFFFFGECEAIYPADYFAPWPGATPNGQLTESAAVSGDYWGYAVYGEIKFQLNDTLDISVGLRYSYDEKEFSFHAPLSDSALSPVLLFCFTTPSPMTSNKDWDDVSPRLVLRYVPHDDLMIYGSVTEGYKAGGYDSFAVSGLDPIDFVVVPSTTLNAFDPESVISYEVGLKANIWGDKARISVAGYSYEYEDLQLASFEGALLAVDNVAEAKGSGIEAQLLARPNKYLDINFGVAWGDSEIVSASFDACAELDGTSCSGNRLPFQPEWSLNASIIGRMPVGVLDVFITSEVVHETEWFSDLNNAAVLELPSYTEVNFRGGIESESWTFTVYIENAFDEKYFSSSYDFFGDGSFPIAFSPNKERTVGADIRYEF